MPYDVALMSDEDFAVGLIPDVSQTVLDAVDQRLYAGATLYVTPQHFGVDDISLADLKSLACFAGRYRKQSDNLLNLEGTGLHSWLGGDSDGGDMYVGASGTTASLDLEAQLDARVFAFANGLTKGTVNSDATARTLKIERATTRLQWLDTICAAYTDDWEYRINFDGTVDVNLAATLWPTNTTPTVVLTQEGGREGTITGLRADLDIGQIDTEDWLSQVRARWNTTPGDDGIADNTAAATWTNADGSADPIERALVDFSPQVPFKEKRNKSLRFNAAAYAAWALNSNTQATRLATRLADQADNYAIEITAEIDEYHPTRFVTAGDKVYLYDLELGLVNTGNEVYYRGSAIHPTTARVQRVTVPIQEGNGVYLNRWDGAAFDLYDLTGSVAFEEDSTQIELGTRRAFTKDKARPKRINRKRFLRKQRDYYLLTKYLESQR